MTTRPLCNPRGGGLTGITLPARRTRMMLLLGLSICLAPGLAGAAVSPRETISLNEGWRFQMDAADLGETDGWHLPEYDRSSWGRVAVPRAWDLYETALWGYEGLGWYALELPGALARTGRVQKLHFDRVNYHTKVWLNGALLGENRDGWMPFEFDVTGRLRPDCVNHLVLRVDNRPRPEWLPGGKRIEWVQYGGLLGPVTLENCAPAHVADLTVVATSAVVRCTLQIASNRSQSLSLRLRAGTREAQTNLQTSAAGPVTVTLSLTLADPRWWSPETPHLYLLEAELWDGEALVDRLTERFGLRRIATAGRQILLNDRPLHIRGVNRYDEYAPYGPNPPRERVIADLQAMRRAGINAVRVHYPQSPELIALYDEMGFLLIEELPINWWQLHPHGPNTPENDILKPALATLERMIRRDKNHPCLVIWSMANESPTDTPLGIRTMQALMHRTRELDPTRLVTFVASPGDLQRHRAFAKADLVGANVYAGTLHGPLARRHSEIEERVYQATRRYLQEAVAAFPGKPLLVTEFGTKGVRGLRGDALFTEDFQAECIRASWRAIAENPDVAGGVLWCWADYYHRRDFIEYAAFGPYGVVTVDRQPKLALDTLRELFATSGR
jgi:beta-galactosidase/beta-glucuronidase